MKETTRDEGGLRAALDACKLVWLTGVVLWHAAGCGSEPSCFGDDAASLGVAAYVPRLLGVVMLSGLMLASGVKDAIRTVSVRSALQPALVALAYQLVDALFIRPVLLGGQATIATAGHVWFLYSLSIARLFGLVLSPNKLLIITIVLNVTTAYVWRFMDDDVLQFAERPPAGLAASPAEWFDSFGVRWTWFYAVGRVLTPPTSLIRWRTHVTTNGHLVNWAIILATMAYSATRLTLNPSTHFFAHGWAFGDWPSLLIRHVELLVLATIGPVACLLVAPSAPSFLSECGGHTLLVYLAHPVALKMLVRPATRVIVGSSLNAPARAVIVLGVPLALQTALHLASILCWRDKRAQRRRLPRLLALAAAVAICVDYQPERHRARSLISTQVAAVAATRAYAHSPTLAAPRPTTTTAFRRGPTTATFRFHAAPTRPGEARKAGHIYMKTRAADARGELRLVPPAPNRAVVKVESRVLDLETNQTAEDVYVHHWVVRVDDGDAFYHGIIDWELVARTEDQQSFEFPPGTGFPWDAATPWRFEYHIIDTRNADRGECAQCKCLGGARGSHMCCGDSMTACDASEGDERRLVVVLEVTHVDRRAVSYVRPSVLGGEVDFDAVRSCSAGWPGAATLRLHDDEARAMPPVPLSTQLKCPHYSYSKIEDVDALARFRDVRRITGHLHKGGARLLVYVGASLVCEVRRREDGSMGTCDFEGGVDLGRQGALTLVGEYDAATPVLGAMAQFYVFAAGAPPAKWAKAPFRSVAEPTPKPFAGPGRCTIPKDVGASIEALRLYPTAIGANVAAEVDRHNVYGPLYRKWLQGPGQTWRAPEYLLARELACAVDDASIRAGSDPPPVRGTRLLAAYAVRPLAPGQSRIRGRGDGRDASAEAGAEWAEMRVPHPGGNVAVVRTKPSVVDDVSGRTLSPDDVFPHHWLARVRKRARVSQLQMDHQFGGGGPLESETIAPAGYGFEWSRDAPWHLEYHLIDLRGTQAESCAECVCLGGVRGGWPCCLDGQFCETASLAKPRQTHFILAVDYVDAAAVATFAATVLAAHVGPDFDAVRSCSVDYVGHAVPGVLGDDAMAAAPPSHLHPRPEPSSACPFYARASFNIPKERRTIVGFRGHLHPGGRTISAYVNGRRVCELHPGLGEPASSNPRQRLCQLAAPLQLRKGDVLTVLGEYDAMRPRLGAMAHLMIYALDDSSSEGDGRRVVLRPRDTLGAGAAACRLPASKRLVASLPSLAAYPFAVGANLKAEVAAHRLGGVVAGLPGLRARLKWTAVRARYKDVVLARNLQCVVAEAGAAAPR